MEELNELADALAKAQGEIHAAPKDAANPYFKSRYPSLQAVREAMQAAFAKNGLSVVQMPQVQDGQLQLRTVLLHSSGQMLDCGILAADVDLANPQKIGSAITYFRRYSLAAISQTVADEDDDANIASTPAPKPAQPSPQSQKYITDALGEISKAKTMEELTALGVMLKDKPREVQDAVRQAYKARVQQLKEQGEN